ncbi:MAG: hypothetical protein IKR86_02850 [Candidatus Methanomethylophilaceae archaeon]|nr:hypothetical protein [Candidatus Methanomethylophilaceae archaeon]
MRGTVRPHEGFKRNYGGTISKDHIRTYWRYDGYESEYTASMMMRPTYPDLLWSRLNYFFHWRRCLYEGECLDTDIGYIWLHAMELLVVDDDPLENHECLSRMREGYRGQDAEVDEILDETLSYFEASHGLEITDTENLGRSYRIVRMCRKLSSPRLDPLTSGDLRFITGYKGKTIDRYADAAAPIVSAVLHEIGRMYQGKGILELCGRPTDIQLTMPFREAFLGSLRHQMTLRCRDLKRSEPFVELVKGVQRACIMSLAGKSEPLKGNLGKYQKILDRCLSAWKDGRLDDITTPYDKLASPVALVNRVVIQFNDCLMHHSRDATWPSYRFRSRMSEYGDIRLPSPSGFRSPRDRRPSYSRMTLDEYACYQSWKESVLKGEAAADCEGFMWLLVNEAIHDESLEPGSAMEILRACRAASSGTQRTRVESAMADWCILHGLEADVSELYCDRVRLEVILTRALSSDPPGRLSQGLLERLCQDIGRKADTDLVNASVAALYRYHGNTLGELFGQGLSKMQVMVFEDCACMPASFTMSAFTDMGGPIKFLRDVCTIVSSVQDGSPSPRCPQGFGSRNRDIIRDAALEAIEARKALRIRSISSNVELDMDAVDSATEDLRAVTGMMSSGEEDEPAPEPEELAEEPAVYEDPWEELASRLTPELAMYISGCLEGRRPDARAEKAVNDISMDTVGDVVVEDGRAVEDYADRLESMLRGMDGINKI